MILPMLEAITGTPRNGASTDPGRPLHAFRAHISTVTLKSRAAKKSGASCPGRSHNPTPSSPDAPRGQQHLEARVLPMRLVKRFPISRWIDLVRQML